MNNRKLVQVSEIRSCIQSSFCWQTPFDMKNPVKRCCGKFNSNLEWNIIGDEIPEWCPLPEWDGE